MVFLACHDTVKFAYNVQFFKWVVVGVYWNVTERFHASAFQERLFSKILAGRQKEDFNPFDIYQYVGEGKRRAFLEKQTVYNISKKQNLMNAL